MSPLRTWTLEPPSNQAAAWSFLVVAEGKEGGGGAGGDVCMFSYLLDDNVG